MGKNLFISDFYCVCCGNKGIPIPRKYNKSHESGHLKKIYCMYCKTETNHAEIRPFGHYLYSDFQKEFQLGRFVNGQRVPINDLKNCDKNCPYNQNGKCWNANNKYKCEDKK